MSFFHEIELGPQCHPNLLVFVVEEFWSNFQDLLLSTFLAIWKIRSLCLDCTLNLRHSFLHSKSLRWCLKTLSLSSEMLKKLSLRRLLVVPLNNNSSLEFWKCVASSAFFKWKEIHQTRETNCVSPSYSVCFMLLL